MSGENIQWHRDSCMEDVLCKVWRNIGKIHCHIARCRQLSCISILFPTCPH
jgi:hypothetical protein